jgi:hypothetical protein
VPTAINGKDQRIRIEMEAQGRHSKVFIGDREVKYVTGIRIEAGVNGSTHVHLSMIAMGGVTVEGIACLVSVSVETEEELRARATASVPSEVSVCGQTSRVFLKG